ncbi:hypothetical protein RI845_00810 [Thalassotalea nanhaiensis]|uniref:Outer membrane protein beta-barrel domain-containing protein n=1 Tax=Thalassotalea nanhaiensis TaxID=3065648 RepID=A0ABY9TIP4_9GAMM|nr:hypothetical protein RI845_00810 [Colwelliaceae bacterium SQ345]
MRKTLILIASLAFVAVIVLFFMPDFPNNETKEITVKQTTKPQAAKTNDLAKVTEEQQYSSVDDASEDVVDGETSSEQPPTIKTDIDKVLSVQKISYLRHNRYFKNQRNIFALNNRSEEEKAIDALQFNPYWGLEADYANLKGAHKGQDAVMDEASEVRFRDSADSSAMMINIIGFVPLTEKSSLFAKVGVNNWEIEESQANELSANQRPVYGQPGMNSDLDGGTDMFYGIGFKYDYESFILKSEMQVFEINGEEHEVFTIGGDFKF